MSCLFFYITHVRSVRNGRYAFGDVQQMRFEILVLTDKFQGFVAKTKMLVSCAIIV